MVHGFGWIIEFLRLLAGHDTNNVLDFSRSEVEEHASWNQIQAQKLHRNDDAPNAAKAAGGGGVAAGAGDEEAAGADDGAAAEAARQSSSLLVVLLLLRLLVVFLFFAFLSSFSFFGGWDPAA